MLAFRMADIAPQGFWMCDVLLTSFLPTFLSVVYSSVSNSYGALASVTVGVVLRGLSGVRAWALDPVLRWPAYTEAPGLPAGPQLFPFRTVIFLLSIAVNLVVSHATDHLCANHGRLSQTRGAKSASLQRSCSAGSAPAMFPSPSRSSVTQQSSERSKSPSGSQAAAPGGEGERDHALV